MESAIESDLVGNADTQRLNLAELGRHPARPVSVALPESERDLALKIINPSIRQFDENGELARLMDAPEAADFAGARPSEVKQPQMQWPMAGWNATARNGLIRQDWAQLNGTLAAHPVQQSKLSAPALEFDGQRLIAVGDPEQPAQFSSPDFRGIADRVTVGMQTQSIDFTSQVKTTLWPAQSR